MEFFAEGRRRIDLIRFGKFGNAWWDKDADADNHTEDIPIPYRDFEHSYWYEAEPRLQLMFND